MSIFRSIVKKEALHIMRDTRTMLITVLMPIVLLLLFGFAISMEVNNVRVAAVVDRHTDRTRSVIEKLRADEYFTFEGVVTEKEAPDLLRKGKADAILFLRDVRGRMITHIEADASNPVNGQASAAYLGSIVSSDPPSKILTRTLYNPQLKSAYNFVPGIMGMIFILICAMMTSVSIVSEKESGTMDLLLVSPVNPRTVILGKLVPYFLLSCVILAAMLTMAYTLLGLPVSATMISVVALSVLYVILSLSIGLLVSTLVSNQVSALIVSAVLFMLPVLMLSGMIFPIDNMPEIFQWISCAIPARWYIEAMRKLMVQELAFTYVVRETVILLIMAAGFISLSINKFNSQK